MEDYFGVIYISLMLLAAFGLCAYTIWLLISPTFDGTKISNVISDEITKPLRLAVAVDDPSIMADYVRQAGSVLGKYSLDSVYEIERYQKSEGGQPWTSGSPNPAKLKAAYLELVDLEKIWGNTPSSACRNILERIRSTLEAKAHIHHGLWIKQNRKRLSRQKEI